MDTCSLQQVANICTILSGMQRVGLASQHTSAFHSHQKVTSQVIRKVIVAGLLGLNQAQNIGTSSLAIMQHVGNSQHQASTACSTTPDHVLQLA